MARRTALLSLTLLALPSAAWAQADSDLEQARRTFADGLAHENAGRCDEALAEYRRVQAVKDTANVRFRLGSCSEKTGRLRAAMRSYEGAIRLGRGDAQAKDVVAEAEARIEALTPKMARLEVRAPAGAAVRLDDEDVGDAELAEPVWVEAGRHTLVATAAGKKPSRLEFGAEAGRATPLDVVLDDEAPRPPPPPHEPAPLAPSRVRSVAGWSLVGLGGALGIGAAISLAVRESSIATLRDACAPACPASRQAELEDARGRALATGPLAAVLAVAGGVSLVTGAIVLATAPRRSAFLAPSAGPGFAGAVAGGSF